VAIPGWYAGRSGRYHSYDTERKNALRSRVLLDLRRGKIPLPLTQEVMTFGRASEMSEAEKKKMKKWVDDEKATKDPTQKLITLAFGSGHRFGTAPAAPRGRPNVYRLDFGRFEGMTLYEVSCTTASDGHWGPVYLFNFLGAAKFNWKFP